VIAIRADSIAPTILAHALNNGIVILLSRNELPGLAGSLTDHPILGLAICAGTTAIGLVIAVRGDRT
jgi:membrane protease YdiL (CAAX protease family)